MTDLVKAGGSATIDADLGDADLGEANRGEAELGDQPAAQPLDGRRASVVLVTGMAGAGRSLALKFFEDLGYEAVDNLPISMLRMLIRTSFAERGPGRSAGGSGLPINRPLALGIDTRTRVFSV
jgi:UPF0042 nucleotide-binding protein